MRSFVVLGGALAISCWCLFLAYLSDHPDRQRWITGGWLGIASVLLAGLLLLAFGS
jgi:hypothetical protein